ncbi:MAG: putative addiction module antidote protein [Gammaproteobacteria bacterium]|jgi:probable addiction module antidote protein|nr:putative addiction module antidote protein [Gammaproteobacteria bacterium]MBT3490130.1 putative addiction module antidote protein [Gammaproteobacteria bacterium]MBT3718546.1 putative addiction module antidote protein [Gammaproteobacteria bacterium]MBT3843695.1 putative addiction module antidote protein [Gammaproteobacteria bacterium]MBT3894402.1 putative addiction module antidote protein [Gammaproteobacteria bacterium]
MNQTKTISNLSEFDMAEYLTTEEEIVEYIRQVLEDGDAGELAAALGHIAKARGMSEIAKASGIKREALYKALRPSSQPRFETIQRVCNALGVKITATAAH